jgi:hypothetical protein
VILYMYRRSGRARDADEEGSRGAVESGRTSCLLESVGTWAGGVRRGTRATPIVGPVEA